MPRYIEYGSLAQFVQKAFPWPKEIKWIDDDGFKTLPKRRLAKIYPTTLGTHDHWQALYVEIIDKDKGKIDGKQFRFDAHLTGDPSEHSTKAGQQRLEVIGYCGYDWYILRPKDSAPIVKAILDYIDLFK